MKAQYINHSAGDDMGAYSFKISFKSITKEFFIYQVKLADIFDLVKVINGIMNKEFEIGYNKEYFKK